MTTGSSKKGTTPARILLVDDNEMGLRARTVVLEEFGHHITAVCCSLAALEKFGAQPFDLVVTDYRMPKLDGIELIARMRTLNPATPIILISGFAEPLGLNESNTGADIVLQKNCHEIAALTRAVTRLLTRRPPKKPVRRQTAVASHAIAAGH